MEATFIFKKHELSLEQGSASFFYELKTPDKTYKFTETLSFPRPPLDRLSGGLTPFLDTLLLILGISYWKTFCSKKIETPTITLSQEQAQFWNTVYTKGLGEFFYKNRIDYRELVKFPYRESSQSSLKQQDPSTSSLRSVARDDRKILLLFGGGKDSIVSAELLKKTGKQFTLLLVNTSQVQEETSKIVNAERIIIKRVIDPKLLALNKESGVYNGHVPVTAIWECIGLFIAELFGYSYVIASNEHSASYGNIEYLGEEMNHQWSKSLEFEKLMQEYAKKYITTNTIPFSLLRSLNEIQIVKQFVNYPQYFPYFSSCNRNFRITNPESRLRPELRPRGITNHEKWCGQCPKCLFVFILLSAFLPKHKIILIFGKNLLANEHLLPLFKELLGLTKAKPFECVGTPEEVMVALYLIYKKMEYSTDVLMKFFIDKIMPISNNLEQETSLLLDQKGENMLPNDFLDVILF